MYVAITFLQRRTFAIAPVNNKTRWFWCFPSGSSIYARMCIRASSISPRSLAPFERNSGYRRAPRLAVGTSVSLFKADLYPRYIPLSLSSKELRARFIASSDGRRFVAPVGCLISHPLNALFIARLTISDNARGPSRERTEGKCDGRADKRDPLDKCSRTGARIDIGAPRSRYTPAINHLYRVNIILPS